MKRSRCGLSHVRSQSISSGSTWTLGGAPPTRARIRSQKAAGYGALHWRARHWNRALGAQNVVWGLWPRGPWYAARCHHSNLARGPRQEASHGLAGFLLRWVCAEEKVIEVSVASLLAQGVV